ncbi:MAG: alpha/beta fold hydrolase [Parachlamydiaceae bacterium]
MSIRIEALHGFLGRPKDWEILSEIPYHAVDLFHDYPIVPLREWAEAFTAPSKRVLLGYSLGGRLALHALIRHPADWDAAIFVSTHPGLYSKEERQKRLEADYRWAERFENDSWDSLMDAWNAQSVFCNSLEGSAHLLERCESDYQRPLLASALRNWSLGTQEDLRERLSELEIPILWMVGENDTKYRELALNIRLKHPLSRIVLVANSGHRIPWEQPQFFLSTVKQFSA